MQGWGKTSDFSMTSAILVGAVPWRGEGAGNGLPKRIFRKSELDIEFRSATSSAESHSSFRSCRTGGFKAGSMAERMA